jgi:Spondin-like TSP1 domain/von Willebrand factor type D domain/Thrombospondin type 1 domain
MSKVSIILAVALAAMALLVVVPTTVVAFDDATELGFEDLQADELPTTTGDLADTVDVDDIMQLDSSVVQSTEPSVPSASELMRFASVRDDANSTNSTAYVNGTMHSNHTIVMNGVPNNVTNSSSYQNTFKAGRHYGPPRLLIEDVNLPARCVAWGYPNSMISFDSARYRYDGHGEFVMFKQESAHEEVRILQRRATNVSHVYAVGFKSGDDIATIRLGPQTNATGELKVIVTVNGKVVDPDINPAVASFMFLSQGYFHRNNRILSMQNSRGTRVAVSVHRWSELTHMNVYLQTGSASWNATTGLCGTFNLDSADDFTTRDGSVASSAGSFAKSWGQNTEKSTFFSSFEPSAEAAVADEKPIKASDYAVDARALQQANRVCAAFTAEIKDECAMNVLVGGLDAVEEVAHVQVVSTEGQLVPDTDAAKCVKGDFTLGDWTPFGVCSAVCGHGVENRTRTVLKSGAQCGTIYQLRSCEQACEHIGLWGKCVSYGAGHIVTFDRDNYDYQGTGEYLMYRHTAHREQVHVTKYRPFKDAQFSYTSGVSFKFGNDVFSMQLLAPTYDHVVFRYNGEYVVPQSSRILYGFFTVSQTGKFGVPGQRYIVEVRVPGGTTLTASFHEYKDMDQMNAYIEVPGSKIGETDGLCGNFNFNPADDRVSFFTGRVDLNASTSGFSWNVNRNQSLFTDPAPDAAAPVISRLVPLNMPNSKVDKDTARANCMDVQNELRIACEIDILAADTSAMGTIRDVTTILGEYRVTVPETSLTCVKQLGTSLGAAGDFSTECSAKCGPGSLDRHRNIIAANGSSCGFLTEHKFCEITPCPQDCVLTAFSNWTECSAKCGEGTQFRNRSVLLAAAHGGHPCLDLKESKTCKIRDCCQYTKWGQWSSCNAGLMARNRQIVAGSECGPTREVKACCEVGNWGAWGPCLGGFRTRSRNVVGAAECGNKIERKPCCEVSGWGEWSACVDGSQHREREVVGAETCGAKKEQRACCNIGQWSEWGSCTNGQQQRRRLVTGANSCATVHERSQARECCIIGNFTAWSTCHNGKQTRSRLVVGAKSCGSTSEERPCCLVGDWSDWDICVNGKQKRSRVIVGDANCGARVQTQKCCQVGKWTAWSKCDDGKKSRTRWVKGHERCHYEHQAKEVKLCCQIEAWSTWSSCSDEGIIRRTRKVAGVSECNQTNIASTEEKPCCKVGEWNDWSKCNGLGQMSRSRNVSGHARCSKEVPAKETKACCYVSDWGEWTDCIRGIKRRERRVAGHDECFKQNPRIESVKCGGDDTAAVNSTQSTTTGTTNTTAQKPAAVNETVFTRKPLADSAACACPCVAPCTQVCHNSCNKTQGHRVEADIKPNSPPATMKFRQVKQSTNDETVDMNTLNAGLDAEDLVGLGDAAPVAQVQQHEKEPAAPDMNFKVSDSDVSDFFSFF